LRELIEVLADGNFHSGTELGERLGLTRAAVWKKMASLRQLGLEVYSVRGRGYRLVQPLELLRESRIIGHMSSPARQAFQGLSLHWELDSTNRYLMEKAGDFSSGQLCMAERQTAGRGRRGREWVSPFGSNLYLSVLWRFDKAAAALSGLSLALGVGVVRALEQVGASGAQLKWPNDILWQGRKLAGILVELAGETEGPCYVVVGVGVNLNMPAHARSGIGQPWADVSEMAPVGRNALAGAIASSLIDSLERFDGDGLGAFAQAWERYHAHAGAMVRLEMPSRTVEGRALGIDETGALVLQIAGEIRRFASGEISLRPLGSTP
jgi:BirA family biotin operon repressor/biotin-[acetyl-CoA-carboxylase] ligase